MRANRPATQIEALLTITLTVALREASLFTNSPLFVPDDRRCSLSSLSVWLDASTRARLGSRAAQRKVRRLCLYRSQPCPGGRRYRDSSDHPWPGSAARVARCQSIDRTADLDAQADHCEVCRSASAWQIDSVPGPGGQRSRLASREVRAG